METESPTSLIHVDIVVNLEGYRRSAAAVITHCDTCSMCVKNEVVEVVELLVLVVEVELVVVVLVVPASGVVVVVVVLEVAGGVAELGLVCWVVSVTHLLLHERVFALEARVVVGRSHHDRLLARVGDRLRGPVVRPEPAAGCWWWTLELPPPMPMHPESSTADPATRSTPPRRCRCRCNFIFPLLYCWAAVVGVVAPGFVAPAAADPVVPDPLALGRPALIHTEGVKGHGDAQIGAAFGFRGSQVPLVPVESSPSLSWMDLTVSSLPGPATSCSTR